jgi:hypothetical protein
MNEISMDINHLMKKNGFAAGSSGGGCEWYTKQIAYKGKQAYIAVTDDGGLDLPQSLNDPVYVGIYDMEDGDMLKEAKLYPSLKDYLNSLRKSET